MLAPIGCSGGNTPESSPAATAAAASEPAAQTDAATQQTDPQNDFTPYGRYEETVKLTVGKTLYANANFIDGQDSRNNPNLDLLKDVLNVEFDILWEVATTDYPNKLSLSIASNAMPDMFQINNDYTTFKTLAESGALADLTEAYNLCASDYMKDVINSFVGDRFAPLTFDGKIYAYPNSNLGFNQNLLWVRQDWLDKLSLQAPKTLEDIKGIARAFIEQDPGGNGAGNTLGLVLQAEKPLNRYSNFLGSEPIAHMVGAFPTMWLDNNGGKVSYGSIAPEMKTALGILAEMYSEGLIDKSFLTRDASESEALLKDGRSGLFFGPWWAGWTLQPMTEKFPEAKWTPVLAPLNAEGKFVHGAPPTAPVVLVASADCPHPEALIKILNVEFDAYRGINKEWHARIAQLIDDATLFQAFMPTGDINLDYYTTIPINGHKIKDYIETGIYAKEDITSDYEIQMAEAAKVFAETGSLEDVNGWISYHVYYKAGTAVDDPLNVEVKDAFEYSTESMPLLKPSLDTMEFEMILQIITGDKPLDYFDEFVASWLASGGETITNEVNEILGR
jgi:putative aldouronate transport system substrate-binding protein